MLDSIYHMMFKLFCNSVFGVKMSTFSRYYYMKCCYERHFIMLQKSVNLFNLSQNISYRRDVMIRPEFFLLVFN